MKNNVQKIRVSKEMTQRQLAQLMGMQTQTVSNIENARHKPRPITLQKLSRVLGVSIEELFSEEDEHSVSFARAS